MCCNKIKRNVVGFAVFDHIGNPSVNRGGGTADTKLLVYAFNGEGGMLIKLEIILFCSCEEKVEVRLVPNFEIPSFNLVNAKSVNAMLCKRADKVGPLIIILR